MNIIIVDDDRLVCTSLDHMLSREEDMRVVGIADSGEQAVRLCSENPPDLVLMDIRMPGMDGIQATRLIKKEFPRVRIVMLTTFQDKQEIHMALQAGAEGYLLKTERIADIARKLRLLYDGIAVLDGEVLKKLTSIEVPSLEALTPREKDVLGLVAQGFTNKEIGRRLSLSEGTVRNVTSVLMDKLNVRNRTQLCLLVRDSSRRKP